MLTGKGYHQFAKHYQQIAARVEELADAEYKKRKLWRGGCVESFEIHPDGTIEVEFHEPGVGFWGAVRLTHSSSMLMICLRNCFENSSDHK